MPQPDESHVAAERLREAERQLHQRPSLGRIVHVRVPAEPDSDDPFEVVSGIVTKVHSDRVINVTVFPDGRPPRYSSSQPLVDADDSRYGWFWPPRV